jgi:effector-binding domain-containing protein
MPTEAVPDSPGVALVRVAPQPTLAVPAQVEQGELARAIPKLLDDVYRLIHERQIEHGGLNVVLYRGCSDIEAGVLVSEPMRGEGRVVASLLPGGTIATTRYAGSYEGLGVAHEAIRRWIDEQGLALAGPSWEIYGHWDDDPEKRYTQVSYLLRDGDA